MSETNQMANTSINEVATELRNACDTMLKEFEAEVSYVQNKVSTHAPSGKFKAITGSKINSAIYNQLLEAVTSDSSIFGSDPKGSCIKLAVSICLKIQGTAQEKEITEVEGVRALTPEDITRLTNFVIESKNYTGDQICSKPSKEDQCLQKVQMEFLYINNRIPLFSRMYRSIQNDYNKALEDSHMLQLEVADKTQQLDYESAKYLSEVQKAIELLAAARDGQRPVSFMKKLTYPNDSAKCTCGICNTEIPASNILRARLTSCKLELYKTASAQLSSRMFNTASQSLNSETSAEISKILRNAGLIFPVECTNPDCRGINIPSLRFLYFFKYNTIARWCKSTPVLENDGAILIYSSAAVNDCVDFLLQGQPADKKQQLIDSLRPTPVSNTAEVELPEVELTDLFSRETYTSYFAGLNSQISSRLLADNNTKNIYLLQYILSTLHITSIGTSPKDMLYTVLFYPAFGEITEKIISVAESIAQKKPDLEALKFIYSVRTSDDWEAPYSRFNDMILGRDYIQNAVNKLEDTTSKEIKDSDYSISVITTVMHKLESELDSLYTSLSKYAEELKKALQHKIFEAFGVQDTDDMEYIDYSQYESSDIVLKRCTIKNSAIFETDVARLIWEHISEMYIPLLFQTVMENAKAITGAKFVFSQVFRAKATTGAASMRGRARDLIENLLGLQFKISEADAQNTSWILKMILVACMQCTDYEVICRNTGISATQLLSNSIVQLPTTEQWESLIIYSILDDTVFDVGLSEFAYGASIDEYAQMLSNANQTDSDAASALTNEACEAMAEAAATFYVKFSPTDRNKDRLKKELAELDPAVSRVQLD